MSGRAVYGLAILGLGAALGFVVLRIAIGFEEVASQRAAASVGLARYPSETVSRQPGTRLRVVFLGDSRAAAWEAPGLEGVEFFNRGVGGEPSSQTRARFRHHVVPLEPDVVVVQTCVNQLKLWSLLPWRREQLVDQCLEDLADVIDQARAIRARIVLTTVFPVRRAPLPYGLFYTDSVGAGIARANARIRELVAPDVLLLDAATQLAEDGGALRAEFAADWLHVSARGYAELNGDLIRLLQSD